MTEKDVYDVSFRTRVLRESVTGRTAEFLKKAGTRQQERQRVELAISAFWSAYAHEQSKELTEVALQSILDLSEQILQIALLADLPVNQLNFKSQVLALIQQTKAQGKTALVQNTAALPVAEPNLSKGKTQVAQPEAPVEPGNGVINAADTSEPKTRRTLFK